MFGVHGTGEMEWCCVRPISERLSAFNSHINHGDYSVDSLSFSLVAYRSVRGDETCLGAGAPSSDEALDARFTSAQSA